MPLAIEGIKDSISQAPAEISSAKDNAELEQIRIKYLGKKGLLSSLLEKIKDFPPDERPLIGKEVNQWKVRVDELLKEKLKSFSKTFLPGADMPDISLPGIVPEIGHIHPLTQIIAEVCGIFREMGFQIVEGPEIDTEYYNFEVLNIPPDHPARDAFATFYLRDDILLRSQTSTLQGRIMEKRKPPLRIIAPGKVYRPDATDATHSFMFHQIEGFAVDSGIRFSDLKGFLEMFLKRVFGEKIRTRFNPHFFPFTEPSAEVEISCIFCQGEGCSSCGGEGWLEILGCGMIHPRVLKNVGYNPERFSGFAFGMGVERIAMLKYHIDDIRLFFQNDLRFLNQF
ncbi:MAG: phenylalanine--tRNA ligase subunit alpha [Candidatus Omnitrophica bacterium]|nr:phenylalanine--tRNA ligase subunit alpha [Candidatus Omnitrophota bacterium]